MMLDFGGLWDEAAMDPHRFTCRKKKNVGMCSFGKKNPSNSVFNGVFCCVVWRFMLSFVYR